MKGIEQVEHALHDLTRPKRSHTFWGFVGVMGVAALLMWMKHSDWIGAPNEHILGESPDGFKNYMTTAWHVVRDSSYVHYGGMGYPYGEHVMFTDNQPIVSAFMQWWSHHISDLSDRVVGWVNVFQVMSLIFGAGVIFLLLRKLHLPVWFAGIGALAMTFLSPQYHRFDGHFGLSHIFFFPLLLLLLCSYEERISRRYPSLHIGLLVWAGAQLHFYYFGLSALFLSLYTAFQVLTRFSVDNLWRRTSHWVVMVLLPFALLNIWLHWSDYCADRPAHPFGFLHYIGYWEGVFLPYASFPLFQWINNNIIQIRPVDFEAQAYVGFAATLFTGYMVWRRFRLFEPVWEEAAYHRVHKHYLRGIFTAATLLLIFACGFPFAIKGLDWIADYMGPVRQFRGLGRFTWGFYYVINVVMLYSVWNWATRSDGFFQGKYRWSRWAIAAFPLALMVYEAHTLQRTKQMKTALNVTRREVFASSPDHWLNRVDFSKFQALMPVPYYHMGSENIWMDLDGGAVFYRKMCTTALHSGVPDMGVNMSRGPISRMVRSVQLSQLACTEPEILDDLPDNRPIAVMVNPARWAESKGPYRHLLRKATRLYESADMMVFSLELDSIRATAKELAAETAQEIADSARYSATLSPLSGHRSGWLDMPPAHRANWRSDRPMKLLLHQDFDSLGTAKRAFQGKGAYHGMMCDTTWLWNAHMPQGEYFISMWVYVKEDMGMTHEMKVIENDPRDGREVHLYHEGLRFYLKTIVNGWALFDFRFFVYEPNSNVQIFLQKKGTKVPFWLDEVVVKDAHSNLYRSEPGWACKNGFWFKR